MFDQIHSDYTLDADANCVFAHSAHCLLLCRRYSVHTLSRDILACCHWPLFGSPTGQYPAVQQTGEGWSAAAGTGDGQVQHHLSSGTLSRGTVLLCSGAVSCLLLLHCVSVGSVCHRFAVVMKINHPFILFFGSCGRCCHWIGWRECAKWVAACWWVRKLRDWKISLENVSVFLDQLLVG